MDLSRIAANSQRFRATVWLREFWSRFHSDSLQDSVMGYSHDSPRERGNRDVRSADVSLPVAWSVSTACKLDSAKTSPCGARTRNRLPAARSRSCTLKSESFQGVQQIVP